MVSLAEMERKLIVELTRAGLDVARQLGGSKAKNDREQDRVRQKLLALTLKFDELPCHML